MAQQGTATKPDTASSSSKTEAAPAASSQSKNDKEKAGYAIGVNIGKNLGSSLKRDSIEIDIPALVHGLTDALTGNKPLLTEDEIKGVIADLQKQARETQAAKVKAESETNKKAGEDFLAANKSKEGVVTLPDGLQYKILKQGAGPKPAATDTVEANYRGTLIDGKEFDSSAKHGDKPAAFSVTAVVKGWTEVLQLMPVGSKYEVYIPSELAYGARGAGADIGPNSTLIFEIELVSIKEMPAKGSTMPPATGANPHDSSMQMPSPAAKPANSAN
jgi:FKBP-type peptidyl-prolyl cis-trans isomerase